MFLRLAVSFNWCQPKSGSSKKRGCDMVITMGLCKLNQSLQVDHRIESCKRLLWLTGVLWKITARHYTFICQVSGSLSIFQWYVIQLQGKLNHEFNQIGRAWKTWHTNYLYEVCSGGQVHGHKRHKSTFLWQYLSQLGRIFRPPNAKKIQGWL